MGHHQLKNLLSKPQLFTPESVRDISDQIMKGELGPASIGAFLTAMKLLGLETNPLFIKEVALAMQHASIDVECGSGLVDIVGTGGDGQDTFNVSTAAAIVAAGAGCAVAKHGNRASSSSCGSADILEELGCKLDKVNSKVAAKILAKSNFCFLFAQMYHPAMKQVAEPRKELGIRTIFNILGPLTNPAKPEIMVVGVPFRELGLIMAQSLQLLQVKRAWVVCGAIGLDEICPEGSTHVWDFTGNGEIKEFTVTPADFGLPEHAISSVRGGDSQTNAKIMNSLLDGQLSGPILDFVLMNAAALLHISGKGASLPESVAIARQSIESGNAKAQLEFYRKISAES